MTYCHAVRGRLNHDRGQHAQKLVKFGRAVFKLCEWTDTSRQTDRQTYSSQYSAPLPRAK